MNIGQLYLTNRKNEINVLFILASVPGWDLQYYITALLYWSRILYWITVYYTVLEQLIQRNTIFKYWLGVLRRIHPFFCSIYIMHLPTIFENNCSPSECVRFIILNIWYNQYYTLYFTIRKLYFISIFQTGQSRKSKITKRIFFAVLNNSDIHRIQHKLWKYFLGKALNPKS